MQTYGGRYSTKAILEVELREVPQTQPPSLCVDDILGAGCLSDPESGDTCNGCHFKRGSVVRPVSCTDCHG